MEGCGQQGKHVLSGVIQRVARGLCLELPPVLEVPSKSSAKGAAWKLEEEPLEAYQSESFTPRETGKSDGLDVEEVHIENLSECPKDLTCQKPCSPAYQKQEEQDKTGVNVKPKALATTEEPEANSWGVVIMCVGCLFLSLYVFLVGLQLLGDSFKCLGGKGAGSMFSAIQNPIAGLMTGVLATVMVQSSSTSTSIVVGLVGAEQISVKTGVPIIMGANIGTSVTNTIVSMGQAGNRLDLERAFAGATVHDMFNYLTVAALLPIEVIVGELNGEGGPLYWLTKVLTDAVTGGKPSGELFDSPIKAITSPVAKFFISNNKAVINGLSLGAPAAASPTTVNVSLCRGSRRLADSEMLNAETSGGRALLSRRLTTIPKGPVDCSHYFCVSKELDKNFKSTSKTAYKSLVQCDGYVLSPAKPCSSQQKCFLNAGSYYTEHISNQRIIKGGITEGAGDLTGGVISLIVAMVLLTCGLFCLTKVLQRLFMGRAKRVIARATMLNDYVAMLLGMVITFCVQSSSVVTSALTPFCGMGLLPLEKMLQLTLGANVGTTITALIAALAKMTTGTVHIALCHLFFNVIGILLWFPVPRMRKVPLSAARLLGLYAAYYRIVPLLYILVAFVLVPSIALGVVALFGMSIVGGIVSLAIILVAVGIFEWWWIRGGCYVVLSKKDRERGRWQLKQAQVQNLSTTRAAAVP